MDEKKIKDLYIMALLTKVLTLADGEADTYYQQIMSSTYGMLDMVKAHIEGESFEDENLSAKFDISDDGEVDPA